MSPAQRFQAWIESLSEAWKTRLRGWLVDVISFGVQAFEDVIAKKMSERLKPLVAKVEGSTEIPPELQPLWNELKEPTGEIAGFLARGVGGSVMSGAFGSLTDWIMRPLLAGLSHNPTYFLPKIEILIGLYYRVHRNKELLYEQCRFHGVDPAHVDQLLKMSEVRFPSEIVAPLWLRDKKAYSILWDDVRQLGVDEFRIDALKEMAYKYPSAEQAITWMAHEVFEEDMVAKYGLDDEANKIDWSFMEKIGINEEVGRKHWRSHWQHASWTQILNMLHRGLIKEQDVYDWFRLVEIPPYWRENMIKTMYDLPGRIEVRMMAQLGLVDKAFIVDILRKDGLAEEYVEVVADMNLVRGIRTDIQSRYTKGWLDSAGVKAELDKSGLSAGIADRLYQWIVTNTKGDRTAAAKDLTKAEIIKGVKSGIIGWDEGLDKLGLMGYDPDESAYLLAISIEATPETASDETKIRIDTIRRLRRQGTIDHTTEVDELIKLGLDPALATAYADNDDLRLTAAAKGGV